MKTHFGNQSCAMFWQQTVRHIAMLITNGSYDVFCLFGHLIQEQIDDTELSCMSNRGLETNTQSHGKAETTAGEEPIASPHDGSKQLNILSVEQDTVEKTESRTASGIGTKYFQISSLYMPIFIMCVVNAI